ncbi:MAG: hypothetical protein VZQ61_06240 [Christensenellaceae bacterium]
MFGLKLKKRDEGKETTEKVEVATENASEPVGEEKEEIITAPVLSETETFVAPVTKKSLQQAEEEKPSKKVRTEFSRFADILNKDEDAIIEECKLFQIRNIMSRISKALVRRGTDAENTRTLVKNAIKSGLGEIAAAPAYLDNVSDAMKSGEELKVSAVVDFPFGESSFKVRFSEIKNSVKKGVDGILTVINTAALKKENAKILKKELKKTGKIKGVGKGAAVNAEDATADDIKQIFKLSEKSGIEYVALMFGSITEAELVAKMKEINAIKGKTPVKVMANVDDVDGVKTLISLGVSGIITPYADDIARELFKEFKIKSEKLL